MPATAAFCRECGAAVPEEDLAQSRKEAAELAAAQLDAVIEMDAVQKKSGRSSAGAAGSTFMDSHQLAAMGLPANFKWAALGAVVIALASGGGYALHRYVTHDDGAAHAPAAADQHAAHKDDHHADKAEDKKSQAHEPAPKASGH
ncbi:MAG: hypothetical protein RI949_916 [Pseudomonadota bacterium]